MFEALASLRAVSRQTNQRALTERGSRLPALAGLSTWGPDPSATPRSVSASLKVGAAFAPFTLVTAQHRTPDDPGALDAAAREPVWEAHE